MFAAARISVLLAVPIVVVLGLGGCDWSQKKPETVATKIGRSVDSSFHERSVRLFGPGVSRKRQTRI
jgi:hypothetical protein